jgi:hypothetical protein
MIILHGRLVVVLASSHLLLVTNGALIGGAREFTSVVNN